VSAQTQLLQQASVLSGRQMVMLLIIALHALFISALMAMRIMPEVKIAQRVTPIDVIKTDEAPTPPPPDLHPNLRIARDKLPDIPQPRIDLHVPDPQIPVAQNVREATPTPTPQDTGTGVVQIATTPLQYRAVRAADDYYPNASLVLQEEGTSIVRVCVAPSGRLDGKPVIETSSGSSRLDAAALLWAREALRFTPATRGGVPVGACKGFRVNFTLH
jgi:TonB family protein